MEKISIVKRRKRNNRGFANGITNEYLKDYNSFTDYEDILKDMLGNNNVVSLDLQEDILKETSKSNNIAPTKPPDTTLNSKVDKNIISFNLSQEQSKVVKSNDYMQSLFNGITNGFIADLEENKEGQIIFKLVLGKVNTIKMLKPQQVCDMLQISKYILSKLISDNDIKSYKIGSLRRFSLDDILDYLSKNEETDNLNPKFPF